MGWHLYKDIRPAHFLGVHAQQFIPILGIAVANSMGAFANVGLLVGSIVYCMFWVTATWFSL